MLAVIIRPPLFASYELLINPAMHLDSDGTWTVWCHDRRVWCGVEHCWHTTSPLDAAVEFDDWLDERGLL